ncbi:endonuclease [Flavobacterium sp. J372]|uniref:endonuclease n=1 Tax=Flavobacterium sp. J372 TaxID=2898436 RepID=UPI0021507ADE|nr:endonuclease [Flavobacterium sp. J372]MCR5862829.1 endonuclease [Flavobacterium sp. J372]
MEKITLLLLLPFYCLAQIPAYYSSVDFTQNAEDIKSQLSALVTTTHTYQLIYTPDVWNALKQSDLDPNDNTKVLLIYGYNDADAITSNDRTRSKDASCHTSSCAGLWVREHVFAQSVGTPPLGQEGPGSDAHHLRAIDAQMNNTRSNKKFTAGSGNAFSVSTASWYPGDEWKGDVARMMMYMYLRYQSQCPPTNIGLGSTSYSPLGDMPNIFLEWNQQDPVSQYELNRNVVLQSMQGNRNPFIDNPYLATMIWGGPQAPDSWGVLATDAEIAEDNVVLYPTITTGIINVENTGGRNFTYSAYNNLGQQVQVQKSGSVIDMANNAKGLYFVTLTDDAGKSKTFRIILN